MMAREAMYFQRRKCFPSIGLSRFHLFGMPFALTPGMTNLDYPRAAAGKMDRWRFLLLALLVLAAGGSAKAQGIPRGIPIPQFPMPSPKGQPTVPSAYRPPQGMCRIWIGGVPPDQQPAPTDCVTAVRNRPANGRVIFSNDIPRKGKEKPKKDKNELER
jgi:hypothetical protein